MFGPRRILLGSILITGLTASTAFLPNRPGHATVSNHRAPSAVTPVKELDLLEPLDKSVGTGRFRDFANKIALGAVPNPPIPPFETPEDPTTAHCTAGKTKSTITVSALLNSNKISHKGDYRRKRVSHGYALARIEVADCDFAEVGLPKGHRGYWVVDVDLQLMFRSHIVDVGLVSDQGGPNAGPEIDRTKELNQRLGFVECPQEHTIGTDLAWVQPRYQVCWVHDPLGTRAFDADHPKPQPVSVRGKTVANLVRGLPAAPRRPFGGDYDPLLWVVCADGCCYADLFK